MGGDEGEETRMRARVKVRVRVRIRVRIRVRVWVMGSRVSRVRNHVIVFVVKKIVVDVHRGIAWVVAAVVSTTTTTT